jgi:hypothetical protein
MSTIMLSVVMLTFVMLSVVALPMIHPFWEIMTAKIVGVTASE